MFSFKVNGTPLVLFPATEAGTEFQHPITAESLGDAFTMPLEVPVRGNEAVLGHVHELALADRTVRINGVEYWRDGECAHRGVFYVQGSTEGPDGTVLLAFTVDDFIGTMAGKNLRDADYGEDIVFLSNGHLVSAATTYNTLAWPAARFCYPMIMNQDAYGDANPDWYPNVEDYDAATGYDVTDPPTLVRYTKDLPVRRERVYRCIGTAPPGENPDNTPGDWEPYGMAIINPWLPTTTGWLTNDEDTGNRFAMCPQFYLKDILTRALATHGYSPVGDFMDDADTHRLVLHNNYLLDQAENNDYVLAAQDTPITYTANDPNTDPAQLHWSNGFDFHLVATDETTPPNQDTLGQWDGTDYTIAAASSYTFKARVKVYSSTAIYLQISVVNPATNAILITGFAGSMADRRNNWDVIFNGQRVFSAGEIGTDVRIIVTPRLFGTDNAGAVGSRSFTLSDCWFNAFRGTGELVNAGARRIHPANHVPDITIEHLLLELRDRHHLRIVPLTDQGILRLDYQQDVLTRPVTQDITPLLRSPMRFDHTARTAGVKFNSPTGNAENLPDLSEHQEYGNVVSEPYELGAPGSDLLKVHVKSTGQQLVSRLYDTNKYGWFIAGMRNNDALMGEEENAREVAPELGTPDMDEVPDHDGTLCLMPVINEKCSGAMFGLGYNAPTLLFYYYHGMCASAYGGTYPFASPYRHDHIGAEVGQVNLTYDPDDAKSLYSLRWKRWVEQLISSDVLEVDVDVATLITAQGIPLERFMARNQVVLFDLMPVKDTNTRRPLISTVRMLKLPSL